MASCVACNTELVPGARWCAICHTNTIDPAVGRLATPGKRFGAYIVDVTIPVVAFFMILTAVGAVGAAAGEDGMGAALGFGILLFVAYVVWALWLFSKGTTPGKRILNMYVVKEAGQRAGFGTMLFREWIGKWISGLFLLIGYLWIMIDDQNQGWHDKLASTFVVQQRA